MVTAEEPEKPWKHWRVEPLPDGSTRFMRAPLRPGRALSELGFGLLLIAVLLLFGLGRPVLSFVRRGDTTGMFLAGGLVLLILVYFAGTILWKALNQVEWIAATGSLLIRSTVFGVGTTRKYSQGRIRVERTGSLAVVDRVLLETPSGAVELTPRGADDRASEDQRAAALVARITGWEFVAP
jgi:hypothetical protein